MLTGCPTSMFLLSIINDNNNDMNSPVIAVIHCFSKKQLFGLFNPTFREN